jgi:hypothetical protein
MVTRVAVGLDQWVVSNNHDVELMTWGLSGCVAMVLSNNTQFSLAHVYSDCDEHSWRNYMNTIFEFYVIMDPNGLCASLISSGGTIPWLPTTLNDWLIGKGVVCEKIKMLEGSGCRVGFNKLFRPKSQPEAWGLSLSIKERDLENFKKLQGDTITVSTAVAQGLVEKHGSLSARAMDSGS